MYRKMVYPLVNRALADMNMLKAQRQEYWVKRDRFNKSDGKDLAFAMTPKDREDLNQIEVRITEVLKDFSEKFVAQQPPLQKALGDLTARVNDYIYRDVKSGSVSEQ